MSHELENDHMAYVGHEPWHGLGVKVDADMTPYQMLKAANLDWSVDALPLHAQTADDVFIEVPGKRALTRSSDKRILSIISDDWKPVQNEEAFRFFNEFVFAGDMEMHTAGSIRQGNMVWGLAKVKESFSLFNGKDVVESYLLFSNPHEYGKSITVQFTPIRVVCNNTLTLSLSMKSDTMVRLNHRRTFDAESVKRMLGIASKKLHTYETVAKLLSSKRYTEPQLHDYYDDVFSNGAEKEEGEDDKKLSRPGRVAQSIIETQPGAEFGEGTWWQAFNSVTYACDHLLGHSDETRLNSAWYGGNRLRKLKALEKAVEYANS